MYNQAPEAGLASLLSSRGRNGDSVLVHMAPEEVSGLQQLAMAHGGSLTINPDTGLYEASFLKKLLPMIVGAVLPGIPGVGQLASTIGFGSKALGSALLVGGATALIEGDLKKGLMAGLGAYSGANLSQALQASAAAPMAPTAQDVATANQATEAAASTVGAGKGAVMNAPLSAKDQILYGGPAPRAFDTSGASTWSAAQPGQAAITAAQATQSAAPTGIKGLFQGAQNLFTSPDSRKAFGQALGGDFQSPMAQNLSKYATFAGAMDAFTPEVKMPSGAGAQDDLVYMPGAFNPNYGLGQQYGKFLPGQYFKKTSKGLVPYNPNQMAPGYAIGGTVGANQQPSIPHQAPAYPAPNQNYPLSTVVQNNYQPSMPVPREVIGGYGPKIDPYTGEELFAAGGAVNPFAAADRDYRPNDPEKPINITNTNYTAPPPPGEADARKRYEQMIYAPPPPPVNTQPVMDYVANLNRRAQNPMVYPYPGATTPITPPGGGGGGGGGGGEGGGGPIAGGGGGGPGGTGTPTTIVDGANTTGRTTWTGRTTTPTTPTTPTKTTTPPDEAVDAAGTENKALDWIKKALGLDDPVGLGLGFISPAAGLIWKVLPATTQQKIKNFVLGVEEVDEEELKNEVQSATQKPNVTSNTTSSTGGGSYGGGSTSGGYGGFSGFGGFGTNPGRKGYVSVEEIKPVAKGGRIRAMQAGGLPTPPNPYGAAVGDDYNFGFAGGGMAAMPTEYLAGGKLLNGPGDGMSDDIPAVIRGKGVQRAALADGEFVVPADVVSHLGNGSTNAGAKKLYGMMNMIRQARTGRTKQAPAVDTDQFLPA